MTAETKNNIDSNKKETSFMFPIWLITLTTMIGTSFICYAYHAYELKKQHNENMEQVAAVEFRTEQYKEYRDIIKKDGTSAAIESINKK